MANIKLFLTRLKILSLSNKQWKTPFNLSLPIDSFIISINLKYISGK